MLFQCAPHAAVCDGLSRPFWRQWPNVGALCLRAKGPKCFIHQPGPLLPQPQQINTCSHTEAHPSTPRLGRRHPPCAVGFSPKVLAFPLSWTLRRGSFLGLGRAWACDPHHDLTPASLWGPASLSPSAPARTHLPPCRGGWAPGAHSPTPSLRGIPFLLPDSAPLCWNFNVLPCGCPCPQGGGWSPHQLLPVTCLCICPPSGPQSPHPHGVLGALDGAQWTMKQANVCAGLGTQRGLAATVPQGHAAGQVGKASAGS